jgi:hypothetical protein
MSRYTHAIPSAAAMNIHGDTLSGSAEGGAVWSTGADADVVTEGACRAVCGGGGRDSPPAPLSRLTVGPLVTKGAVVRVGIRVVVVGGPGSPVVAWNGLCAPTAAARRQTVTTVSSTTGKRTLVHYTAKTPMVDCRRPARYSSSGVAYDVPAALFRTGWYEASTPLSSGEALARLRVATVPADSLYAENIGTLYRDAGASASRKSSSFARGQSILSARPSSSSRTRRRPILHARPGIALNSSEIDRISWSLDP